jgi:menaquinone-dependent protoporphyrinogen IX oxidase
MRIAIVSAPGQRKAPAEYVRALAKGMEAMGHRADVLDVWTGDGFCLPGYEYVAVVAEPLSFFSGKLCEALTKFLAAGSSLVGKKGAAFVKKGGLFTGKALSNVMKAMEKEGMRVNWSDVIYGGAHAAELGKRIGT